MVLVALAAAVQPQHIVSDMGYTARLLYFVKGRSSQLSVDRERTRTSALTNCHGPQQAQSIVNLLRPTYFSKEGVQICFAE